MTTAKVFEIFKVLPPGYRERVVFYWVKRGKRDIPYVDIGDKLVSAFNWHESNESYDFWLGVYRWIMNNKKWPLPILPPPPSRDYFNLIKEEEKEVIMLRQLYNSRLQEYIYSTTNRITRNPYTEYINGYSGYITTSYNPSNTY